MQKKKAFIIWPCLGFNTSMKKEQELDQLKVTIEELLWKDLKKGNLSALGSLYELHVDRLFVYGCKISGDREVIQEYRRLFDHIS